MMTEKRKTNTAEFKREAVRLVTEQRYGVAETTFGIFTWPCSTMRRTPPMMHQRARCSWDCT